MIYKLLSISNAIMKTIGVFYYRQVFRKKIGDTVLPIRPLRQTMSYTCGTVAMLTVGVALSAASISELMRMKNGITINAVKRYMKRHGTAFKEIKSKMSFKRIKSAIDDGYAIVTTTNQSGGHWVTIFGYYDEGIIMGGCGSGLRYAWKEFRSKDIDGCSDGSLLVKIRSNT